MAYRMQYIGSFESGKITTSILDGSDLVRVVISKDTKRKENGLPVWLTYIWDAKKKVFDIEYPKYVVDPSKDIVEKEKDGSPIILTEKHELILTALMKELEGIPVLEQTH